MTPSCPLCRRFSDPESALVIFKGRGAVLSHMPEINLPGYLLLAPLRHVEDAGRLTREEQEEMAALQSRAVKTILKLPDVRKVYIASFGEAVPHLHLHLFPRTGAMLKDPECLSGGVPDGPKIFDLWRRRLAVPAVPDEVRSLILRLREVFNQPFTP